MKFPIPSPHFDYTIGPPFISGYYLYEWLDNHIPFYVGMGKGYRAWNPHSDLTENRRLLCANFKVRILRHHLTKPLAHKLERQRIILRLKQGYTLTNQRVPHVVPNSHPLRKDNPLPPRRRPDHPLRTKSR